MEKGKISSLQMAILLYPSIIATGIISVPSLVAKYAKNDLWIPPIIASIIGFANVLIAYELHKRYPNQTFIECSEQIAGRFAGKIISFSILFFYFIVTGHIVRGYSEFIIGSFLIHTPLIVIIASMTILCAFTVQGGLEVMGRIGILFSPLFILPILSFVILLSPDFEIKNIFPILGNGFMPVIKGSLVPGGWYSELFLIAFLLPYVSDINKGRKYGLLTVVAVMITLVVVNLTVLFVLGPTTSSKVFPLMNATRYVSLGGFLENLEAFAMAVWIVGAFIKISVFYYAAVLGTAQLLNLSDYRILIWPFAIFIVETAYWSIPNSAEYSTYLMTVLPFFGPFAQTFMPLLLLLLAIVRNKSQKQTKKT